MDCLRHATRMALLVLMTAAAAHAEEPRALPAGDAARGQGLYQACSGCHSIDENDVGPRHRGVLGRRAGSLPDYRYSQALRDSHIVWDAASLDRWLTSPQALVPGTKMFFSLPDAQMRADIIAYLAQQK
jgi:cytochrome c